MPITINTDECEGCGTCLPVCPNSAIDLKELGDRIIAEIDTELCDECAQCMEFCLRGAIKQA